MAELVLFMDMFVAQSTSMFLSCTVSTSTKEGADPFREVLQDRLVSAVLYASPQDGEDDAERHGYRSPHVECVGCPSNEIKAVQR